MIASGVILTLGALSSCSNDKTYEPSTGSSQILHFYVAGVETRTATGEINKTNIEEGNTVVFLAYPQDQMSPMVQTTNIM